MCANILLPEFKPEISCTAVNCDGYEVTNLISPSFITRSKGFMAETFLKPPVSVLVICCCPVELSQIVINGRVGQQKSVGFEIETRTPTNDTFFSIGRVILEELEESVTFGNRQFKPRFSLPVKMPSHTASKYCKMCLLNPRSNVDVSNVSQVKITITRTRNSTVPAIGKLEIWAQPSRSCPEKLVQKFLSINTKMIQGESKVPKFDTTTKREICNYEEKEKSSNILNDQPKIPPEFLDCISCDIMTMPLALPSGNCIDQTTLDKYLRNEAAWGRSANDPFTGIRFNSSSKPVADAVLKARIDNFLLQHPSLAKDLGRTTGRKRSNVIDEDKSDGNRDKRLKIDLEHERVCGKSHEENLKESLDLSVRNVLSTMERFTSKVETTQGKNQLICGHESKQAYKLSCSHLLCRKCVMFKKETNQLICDRCSTKFNLSQIVRIHL